MFKKILCIDDDINVLNDLKHHLSDVDVKTYIDSEIALASVADIEKFAPDLFVIDMRIPNINGPELFLQFRKRPKLANIPVIFFTENAQFASYAKPHPPLILGTIHKPFDPEQLFEKILKAWNSY